jgi:intermediate peptidase
MIARIAENAFRKISRSIPKFRGDLRAHELGLVRRTASTLVRPPSSDDAELVSLFDQPQTGQKTSPLFVTGIFQHPQLTTPAAFSALADSTLVRAQLLTERILRARESRSELFKVIKNLDRLSDLLCGVIDLAELLRNAHPDAQWVDCATESYEKLCEFMNVLNTHVGLYEVSHRLLRIFKISPPLTGTAHCTTRPRNRQVPQSRGTTDRPHILA